MPSVRTPPCGFGISTLRTHLHAYACRIYVTAFRASTGLYVYGPAHPAVPPLSASCSSSQRFACGFLQIPPRDGHPCRSANTSPCRVCRGLAPPSKCALPGAPNKSPISSEMGLWCRLMSVGLGWEGWLSPPKPGSATSWLRFENLLHVATGDARAARGRQRRQFLAVDEHLSPSHRWFRAPAGPRNAVHRVLVGVENRVAPTGRPRRSGGELRDRSGAPFLRRSRGAARFRGRGRSALPSCRRSADRGGSCRTRRPCCGRDRWRVSISLPAPVDIWLRKISSAMRPPIRMARLRLKIVARVVVLVVVGQIAW